MGYKYAVLGAGRQGTACAYDMIKLGEADSVLLVDQSPAVAEAAARRVNGLLGVERAHPRQVDVTDHAALVAMLAGIDAFLSAVPYYHNLAITRAAVEARASMCDLGGNTEVVRRQLELDAAARAAGISVVPDCGQVPGMGTSLMVYAMSLLDETDEVLMWDGGLPQKPRPPFNYMATFHLAGLTNEFAEPGLYLREGQPVLVPPLEELEMVDFPPPIGRVEAFTSSGGVSTMPWTFAGKVRTLQNKTIRYPGHLAQLRAFYHLGLWDTEPVRVGEQEVVPRELFHQLFASKVTFPGDRDVCAILIHAMGRKEGRQARAVVEVMDFYDEETGFTAMERTTGWDAAIVAAMMARGQTPCGAVPVELAVPPALFVAELARRGIDVKSRLEVPPAIASGQVAGSGTG
jgi:lysine 6-dehydrogenase